MGSTLHPACGYVLAGQAFDNNKTVSHNVFLMAVGLQDDRVATHAQGPDAQAPSAEAATAIELMGRYCDGDREAFRQLYAMTAPVLMSYLVSMIGDRDTAEDLLQQTFLKIHNARSAYIRGVDPMPWMYAIARSVCIDEMRRQKRRLAWSWRNAGDESLTRSQVNGRTEQTEAERRDTRTRMIDEALEALAALPKRQREALVLTKLQGRSVAEAATITGATSGAIKQRAHRAYLRLREILGDRQESV